MDRKILYLFNNTRSVIKAQQIITAQQLKCLIVPVPRNISSECGMSIEIALGDELVIDPVLIRADIYFSKVKDFE